MRTSSLVTSPLICHVPQDGYDHFDVDFQEVTDVVSRAEQSGLSREDVTKTIITSWRSGITNQLTSVFGSHNLKRTCLTPQVPAMQRSQLRDCTHRLDSPTSLMIWVNRVDTWISQPPIPTSLSHDEGEPSRYVD
jgi:hypothetical protein